MEAPALEISLRNPCDPISHASISIIIVDMYVSDIDVPVEAVSAIVPASPPPVELLMRRQRNPADVAESETEPAAPAKSEECHQRRRPIMPRSECSRIPA